MAIRLQTLGSAIQKLRRRPPGHALAFPNYFGSSAAAPATILPGNNFTLEVCLRVNAWDSVPDTDSGDTSQYVFLSSGPGTSYALAVVLFPNGSIRLQNYATTSYTSGLGLIKVGVWFHLAIVFNYTAGTVHFYLNGQQVYQTTIPATGLKPVRNVYLGHIDSARSSSNLFGAMDEFRLWSVARTAQQISDNYRRPNTALLADGQITSATMACCYDFDTTLPQSDPVLVDNSGHSLNLTSSYTNLSSSQTGPCPTLIGYPAASTTLMALTA